MLTVPLTNFRAEIVSFINKVTATNEPLFVTRTAGHQAVVVLSVAEYSRMQAALLRVAEANLGLAVHASAAAQKPAPKSSKAAA